MPSDTRDYKAARSLFTVIYFFGWLVVVSAGILLLAGLTGIAEYGPLGPNIPASLSIGFYGLLLLGSGQLGGALLDTAENTSKILDHLNRFSSSRDQSVSISSVDSIPRPPEHLTQ